MGNEPSEHDEIFNFGIHGVVRDVSECDDIVIRQTKTTRLFLRTKIVSVGGVCKVRGYLIYERRRPGEVWPTCNHIDLRSIKAGEGLSVELSSNEMAALRQKLCDLQAVADIYGPVQEGNIIALRKKYTLSDSGEDEYEVIPDNTGNENPMAAIISAMLSHEDPRLLMDVIKNTDLDTLQNYRDRIGASTLSMMIGEWSSMEGERDEKVWQRFFSKFSFALCQVFYTPTVIINSEAYVGGKRVDQSGGGVVDFLSKNRFTQRAHLIEIKTPNTKLLSEKEYRNNVWTATRDLTGAVAQVMNYRDQLMGHMPEDVSERAVALRGSPPMCAVIIGNTRELEEDPRKKRAFENFRNRSDVVILTFDEVRDRVVSVRDVLQSAESDQ